MKTITVGSRASVGKMVPVIWNEVERGPYGDTYFQPRSQNVRGRDHKTGVEVRIKRPEIMGGSTEEVNRDIQSIIRKEMGITS